MDSNRIIFPIAARAWFQYNNDGALWYIPLDCRSRHRVTGKEEDKGLACDQYKAGEMFCGHFNEDGKWIGHTLSKQGRQKKDQIEKYNRYRMDLFHLAKKLNFQLPAAGMAIYYHFPVPGWWNKKKKAEMHGQLKASKPDLDNTNKAFFDALTGNDEIVGGLSGNGKYYFNPDLVATELKKGYIEILLDQKVYNPYSVELVNPYAGIEMEDIQSRRAKARAKKEEQKALKEKERTRAKPKPLKIIDQKKLFKKEDKIK